MIRLTKSLSAWGDRAFFEDILRQELENLSAEQLPLQRGLTAGSYALDSHLKAMINGVSEDADYIHVRAGIFYSGIIAGCSCADDPSPIDELNEYCEILVDISKTTAETTIRLHSEPDVGVTKT